MATHLSKERNEMDQEKKKKGILTHVDEEGKAHMVDVGGKVPVHRSATAAGFIRLTAETAERIRENTIKKGDVLTVAQIAGIQAAKQTHHLVPLCHPLPITKIDVQTSLEEKGVAVKSVVRCTGQTGVEMEALTAVQIALLTVYDMCKAIDTEMIMEDIHLVEKKKEAVK